MKTNKGFGTVVAIIIVLVILGGGYYFYREYQENPNIADESNTVIQNEDSGDVVDTNTANNIDVVSEEEYVVYVTFPGFMSSEDYKKWEESRKVCIGRSEPIVEPNAPADVPERAKCFGYLSDAPVQ